MENNAHMRMDLLSARVRVAASLWTVMETGVPMVTVTMTAMITRTGAADSMPSAQMRPTMVMDAHTGIPTSNAPQRAVPSLWTAWELGVVMTLAPTTMNHIRISDAALILWREHLLTMATPAHMLTAMFSAQ